MYKIKGLEYLGRNVVIRGQEKNVEAKRFVTLKTMGTMPSRDEVIRVARANPRVKKAWVMEMDGNNWRKAMDVIDI